MADDDAVLPGMAPEGEDDDDLREDATALFDVDLGAEFAGVFTELRAVGWHGPIFSPGWSGWHGPKISPQARAWAECQARGPCWHGPQARRAVPAREVAGRAWPVPVPGRPDGHI